MEEKMRTLGTELSRLIKILSDEKNSGFRYGMLNYIKELWDLGYRFRLSIRLMRDVAVPYHVMDIEAFMRHKEYSPETSVLLDVYSVSTLNFHTLTSEFQTMIMAAKAMVEIEKRRTFFLDNALNEEKGVYEQ